MNMLRLFLVMVLGVGASWAAVVNGTASIVTGAGPYVAGTPLTIKVDFTGAVDIAAFTSKIRLNLHRLNDDAYAVATSPAPGVTTANFTYTVQAGDYITNSDSYTGASALTGVTNYNGTLSGAFTGISVVTPLTVQSVSSSPSSGTLKISDGAIFTVHLNRFATASNVTAGLKFATGIIGGTTVSGSAVTDGLTSTLSFLYTVDEGESSSDLDYINTSSLLLTGTLDGNSTLSLPAPGGSSSLVVDGIKPTFSITKPSTAQRTAPISYTITASESVSGFTQSDLTTTQCSATLSGSGSSYTSSLTPISTIKLTSDALANATTVIVDNVTSLKVKDPVMIGSQWYKLTAINTATKALTLASALTAFAPADTSVFPPTGVTTVGIAIKGLAASDSAGNQTTAVSSENVVYDPTPPLPIVTAPTPSVAPSSIVFTIKFSEPVSTALLSSGLTVTNGDVSSINGNANPDFTVTVAPIVPTSPVSLTVRAGAVKDSALNDSLVSDICISTPDPDVTAPTITAATSTNANGSYKSGQTLTITLTASEVVNVLGTPKLTLDSGGAANYLSGTGTDTLTFSYVIGSTDSSSDLNITGVNLNGGTIKDPTGNALTLPIPVDLLKTSKDLKIVVPPSITSVQGVPTTPVIYRSGAIVTVTATLSRPVVVATPGPTTAYLSLATGAPGKKAALTTIASTTSTLTFTYTTQIDDLTKDLDYTSTTALDLGNVTIDGLAGLLLALPTPGDTGSLSNTSATVLDNTAIGNPTLAITSQTTPANGSSTNVPVTITASEPVTGFTDPLTDLSLASLNAMATITASNATAYQAILTPIGDIYMSATQPNALQLYLRARSGSPTLLANSYILINGNLAVIDTDTTLNSTSAILVTVKSALPLSIPLNTPVYLPAGISMTVGIPAGAAQDLAGNNNLLTSPMTFIYDPMAPIGSILVPTSSASPYAFTVQFNEPVTAPLAAGFTVTGGTVGNPVPAGTNAWTVPVTPTNAGGGLSLALNANAVRDPALNFNAATTATIFAPTFITKIESVPTTPLIKGSGQTVTLVATLSRPSVLTLTSTLPTLALQTGTAPAQAQLTTLAGTTSTLTFSYTVGSSDNSSDLDVVDANALNLNLATIDGLTTMKVPAPGTAGSLSATSAVTIDTTKPGVTTFGIPSITGPLTAVMAVTFNEPIASTGAGTLETTDFTVTGGALVSQVTLAPDGRNATVRFTLPAASALTSYVVSLNAGAVADPAGNTSTDTPSVTIVYDPVAPVLTLSMTPGDKATVPLSVVVTASKYVTGMAIDDGNVTNGVVSSISAAVGTSFTLGLTPTAPLQLSQAAAIGVTTIRLQAVGGDVTVSAGAVLRVADTMVRLTTTNDTLISSLGATVGIERAMPVALAAGASAWPSTGVVVTTSVRANACTDSIGQNNTAATAPIAVRYDPTPPMFRASVKNYTYDGDIIYTVTSSEPVSGFSKTGIDVTNCVVAGIDPAGTSDRWTVYVTPTASTFLTFGIKAAAATDNAGNASLAEAPTPFTIIPRIVLMTCNNADGTYNPGMRLVIKVFFTENVTVVGSPHLALNLTATGRDAIYKSGSGTKELLFDYTIVEGDATNDLDYLNSRPFTLPDNAAIFDAESYRASLTLGVPGNPTSLSANSAIVVKDGDAAGPGKPGIGDQPAGSGGCGAGSGIALILAGGWLGLGMSLRRRRRAA